MKPLEDKLREALRKDFKNLYQKEFTTAWKENRFIRNIEIGVMGLDNTMKLLHKK